MGLLDKNQPTDKAAFIVALPNWCQVNAIKPRIKQLAGLQCIISIKYKFVKRAIEYSYIHKTTNKERSGFLLNSAHRQK